MTPTVFHILEWTVPMPECFSDSSGQAVIRIHTVSEIPEWTGHDSNCVLDSGVDMP